MIAKSTEIVLYHKSSLKTILKKERNQGKGTHKTKPSKIYFSKTKKGHYYKLKHIERVGDGHYTLEFCYL